MTRGHAAGVETGVALVILKTDAIAEQRRW